MRTLDFGSEPVETKVVYRIPYGDPADELGFAAPCESNCEPPCPCSAQVQPAAFDIGPSGAPGVLDVAKGRVALYSQTGLDRAVDLGSLGPRAFDVQIGDRGDVVVLAQRGDYSTAFILKPSAGGTSTVGVRLNGMRAETGTHFSLAGDRVFLSAFLQEDFVEEEVPIGVPLSPADRGNASEVPGRPFLNGWFVFEDFRGDQVIPLGVRSAEYDWFQEVEFRLQVPDRTDGGEKKGQVSWELEIDPDGTLHLLIFAGTYGRGAVDGYWYLTVEADGRVGQPQRLSGPSEPDDQQTRHLSLDPQGDPVLMWARGDGVEFETLPHA
ncbi:MAG: hypothetical protein GEU78_00630 [Actinobacteria bacterium]|nr:hypothetical protein [Actinomycetota bacterium]